MMRPLRVLITNHALAGRSGTEMYVADLAIGLLRRGHAPIVYSPRLGTLAQELTLASVTVVDDLRSVAATPDIIHGQHTLESAIALLHFPRTPAIYVCHDWSWENDIPPHLPRIRELIAVDHTVRDRLILREGIDESRVSVVSNGVDLKRFLPRGELPAVPRRGLVFSNYMTREQLQVVRAAGLRCGISVDAVGAKLGPVASRPENILGQYDIVFAKGRCAWEAMACGTAVVVCDTWGIGPLVSTQNFEFARERNFGRRLLQTPLSAEAILEQLGLYDAADAKLVSQRIRAECGLELMLDKLLAIYDRAISSHQAAKPASLEDEQRSLAGLLQSWSQRRQPQIDVPDVRNMIREELGVQNAEILGKLDALRMQRRGFRKLVHSLKKRLLPWIASPHSPGVR